MIVVRVELWSVITGEVTELARMHICNVGGDQRLRNYEVTSFTGRSRAQLDRRQVQRQGRVDQWPSQQLHVWNLVAAALRSMSYGVKMPIRHRELPLTGESA